MPGAFDLEKAIAAWRRPYETNRTFSDEDLEELEGSLRDRTEALMAQGFPEDEAFGRAVKRIGFYGATDTEYRKVYWGKLKRQRRRMDELFWRATMVRNYFTIALRNLRKQKGYTLINIFGLAIGLTCFMLISLFVRFELSYDTFHEKADRIYRVVKEDPGNYYLGTNQFAVTSAPLANGLMDEFPEVEHAAQIDKSSLLFNLDGTGFYEEGLYATEHFFNVFSFRLLQGDPATVLVEPNSIVLTESLARKYFGEADPMGQTISIIRSNDPLEMEVVGVVQDVPANSHFTFDYLVSMISLPSYVRNLDDNHWDNNNYLTYASLRPDHSLPEFAAKLPELARKHLSQREYYQENPEAISIYFPQKLTDIHLRSHLNFEFGANGDIKYVYLFSAIALLILLIACINYMNLATARSVARAKEVGVRKVLGAHRMQLVGQFMGEALILAVLALVGAVVLVFLLLPTFNALTAREMTIDLVTGGGLLLMLGLLGIGVGLLSGSYPAFMMSGFHPVMVLKGGLKGRTGKTVLRNVLVVVQFAITIPLIIGTLVIQQQLDYIQRANTGLDRDHVVSIYVKDRAVSGQYDALKQTLQGHPNVLGVTASRHDPTRINSQSGTRSWEGVQEGQRVSVYNTSVYHDYVELFGIELVEGRDFSEEQSTDERMGMLINETLMKQIGWETAVGKWFNLGSREGRIVGVMKDFNFQSFHQEMAPLLIYLDTERFSRVLVKVRPDDMQETLAFLEETMAQFSPAYPFDYQFLDDAYNRMYETEVRLGSLFSYFTTLALLIACLGLLGLAAFTASQRTKEIGMRKVLGASLTDILVLLSKDFTRLVLIAFVLGTPVAYFAMNTWLQEFAYRIPLGWSTFVLAGGAALLLAWLTVSYQSIKVARTNPVDTLRHE